MAKALSGTVKCSISVTHTFTATDGIQATDNIIFTPSLNVSSYLTLASQAGVYHISGALASASNICFSLEAATMPDKFGSNTRFSQIFYIMLRNTSTNSAVPLRIFGGHSGEGTQEFSAPVVKLSGGVVIYGNGSWLAMANRTTANKYTVTAANDELGISNMHATASASYHIVLIGDKL